MLGAPPDPSLERVVIILVEAQNPDNIGGVVRAMMNMGITRLRLVKPKRYDPFRISAAAHRSEDFQKNIEFFDNLVDALTDVNLVVSASTRSRELSPTIQTPSTLAPTIMDHTRVGTPAILFGREDWGLPSDIVQTSDYQLAIPTHPDYRSLNLAQAVLLVAYELREAVLSTDTPLPIRIDPYDPPATDLQIKEAVDSLLDVLESVGFFKPGQEPAKRVKVERLFRRTQPLSSEAGLLRAMGYVLSRNLAKRNEADISN